MKTKLLFVIFIVCISNCYSQNWLWAKSANGTPNSFNELNSVSVDANGNVFIAGVFNSSTLAFGSTTLINAGNTNQFIAKYDANGNMLWAKSVGGTSVITALSVCVDASGNVFLTGDFTSPITFGSNTLSNPGSADVYIAKYDTNGNVLWAKSAGGIGDDFGRSLSTDSSGNVFLTGTYASSTITFGSTTLTNAANISNNSFITNIFLVKYDTNGNVLWAKSSIGTHEDQGSISVDGGGNVILTGTYSSPMITLDTITLINVDSSGSNYEVFIAKYNATGNVLWAKSAGGTSSGESNSARTDAVGNVFVAGTFGGSNITFGSTTLINAGSVGSDAFIAKYDPSGNVLWAKSAGGTDTDRGSSVSADACGNVFFTGLFDSPNITFDSTTLTRTRGSSDPMFVVKFDGNGNVLCASSLSSGGNINFVSADPFGNAYIGGSFYANPFIVGTDTLTHIGQYNIFVAKYKCDKYGTPAASNNKICIGNTASLSVSGAGTLGWYSAATGGAYLGAGANFITPILTANTTYYVQDSICAAISNRTAVFVTVNALPTVTANASATTVCKGSSAMLTGVGANAYTWTGGVIDGIVFVPSITTIYTVTGTDGNNCSNTDTITINVNSLPVPIVTSNASANTLCAGSSVTLTGLGANSYTWSGGVKDGISFVPSSTTTYTVIGTDGNNCSNTATRTINVNSLPIVTANASTTTVCNGSSVTLTGGGASSYVWTGGIIDGLSFVPSSTTIYTVTGNTLGCTGTAIATVAVNPVPIVVVNAISICEGLSSTLTANGAATYVWSNGDVEVSKIVSPTSTTSYTVTGTNVIGCTATAVGKVTVFSKPVAEFNFTPNPLGVLNPVVTFTDQSSSDVNYWNWNFGDGDTLAPNIKNPVHTYPTTETIYAVTLNVHNPQLCSNTVSHNVAIGAGFTFFVPNAFSPNNDKINDVFGASGGGIVKFQLLVFDRWSNLIFSADDINKTWDGKATDGAEIAQQDAYVWKVRLTDEYENEHNFMGIVTIIK